MKTINLRPAIPERDFAQVAALISSQEDERTTEPDLKADYEQHKDQAIRFMVAEDEQGELMGFSWVYRQILNPDLATFYLVIKPEHRRQGAGRGLYADLLPIVEGAGLKRVRVCVLDTCPESRAFIERRGFSEIRHNFVMELDLDAFDDRPYGEVIARLKAEGFCFTSMEELGNTEEAQQKLYILNDTTSLTIPGQNAEPAWSSFEDFQKSPCQSSWYKPAGQIVAIDSATGRWAALSAITRMEGVDYAYNLFTGVDMPYRGRKLGQAVKVLALRYAREVLKVHSVHTRHNTKNLPMIAIDRKFGYQQTCETFLMEKVLE
jgi:RimJ/RimL family protein N-acetyltransferase/GNAT superfamily N-acetyltransferase